MKRNRKGFTLIELLVVIAIIGLLLAMVAPVMGSARGKVHIATCANNLKQIAMAAFMYADDHNYAIPDVKDTANYVQDSNDVYKCPRDTRAGLGINNSSYTAWKYTPVSLLPANTTGSLSESVLYVESDLTKDQVTGTDKLALRHNGRTVVVFVDGHVASYGESQLAAMVMLNPGEENEIPLGP
jgi:prepilin-type N-terminal cleavage/methylation domain-containing protein/prepilin-type processing-associated H-X9-DG protein